MSIPDFFRARLVDMIDPHHPLPVLASRMPWARLEAALAPCFDRRVRPEQSRAIDDLFGSSLQIAGGGVRACRCA